MIRIRGDISEHLNNLFAPIFNGESNDETYLYFNKLKEIVSPDELSSEYYVLYHILDSLTEIYDRQQILPKIDKNVIKHIAEKNLYYMIKKEPEAGFRDTLQKISGELLNVSFDQSIFTCKTIILDNLEKAINKMIELESTFDQGYTYFYIYLDVYRKAITKEATSFMNQLSTEDLTEATKVYTGWRQFLYSNKIKTSDDIPRLYKAIGEYLEQKSMIITQKNLIKLDSIQKLEDMRNKYKLLMQPIFKTNLELFDKHLTLAGGDVTVIVGDKGIGKTTLACHLASMAMAQGRRALIYAPEIDANKLTFSFVLPAYIYEKYGFLTTSAQVVGNEEPYEYTPTLPNGQPGPNSEEKKHLMRLAEEELVENKSLTLLTERESIENFENSLSAKIRDSKAEVIIIDHTTDFNSKYKNQNEITSMLAQTVKTLKKLHENTHFIILSHAGSAFVTPSKDNPIVTSKIVAYSKDIEGAADNILGLVRHKETGLINMFCTKSRWSEIYSYFHTYVFDRDHSIYIYDPKHNKDYQSANVDTDDIDDVKEAMQMADTLSDSENLDFEAELAKAFKHLEEDEGGGDEIDNTKDETKTYSDDDMLNESIDEVFDSNSLLETDEDEIEEDEETEDDDLW